ncbi:MAG: DNA-processing protein DprA [Calditrichota bacterium]
MPSEYSAPTIDDMLKLSTIPGIASARIRMLLNEFGNADAVCSASIRRLTAMRGIDRELARQISKGYDQHIIDFQHEWLRREDTGIIPLWDKNYPPMLKACPDAPLFLFYRGKVPEHWPAILGIVGTRRPTNYGRKTTARFTEELVRRNISIASGFARGIDTIAHQTCVDQGGKTIAILGCGLDCIYPPENKNLFDTMLESHLLLSEYLFGTGPDAMNFPKRNRIISGLSRGVIIIEAGRKSGTLITANYALEQNREVFSVPGNIDSPVSLGTNELIQQGAKLIASIEDIFDELPTLPGKEVATERPLPENLDAREKLLLQLLGNQQLHIDHLVKELEEAPASILSRLLKLELRNLVRQKPGKIFMRN